MLKKWLQVFAKSKKDRWLGGICGGLGERTPLPSWAWRLIFVLITTFYGIGLFIYIVLWIFTPAESEAGNNGE